MKHFIGQQTTLYFINDIICLFVCLSLFLHNVGKLDVPERGHQIQRNPGVTPYPLVLLHARVMHSYMGPWFKVSFERLDQQGIKLQPLGYWSSALPLEHDRWKYDIVIGL